MAFDFAEVAERQHGGDWAGAAALMVDAAHRLERAGAEALVICTNTMHKVADEVQVSVPLPYRSGNHLAIWCCDR
jgi:aspartate racemase